MTLYDLAQRSSHAESDHTWFFLTLVMLGTYLVIAYIGFLTAEWRHRYRNHGEE